MKIKLAGRTLKGGTLMETTPETVTTDMERMLRIFQSQGFHVVESAPFVFDISHRDYDTLSLAGIMYVDAYTQEE